MKSRRQKAVNELSSKLIELKYAKSTHDSYTSEFRKFVNWVFDSRLSRVTEKEIGNYLQQIPGKARSIPSTLPLHSSHHEKPLSARTLPDPALE